MGDEGEQAPKIIVDSDWKSQAQAEKEKLAAQEAKAPPAQGGPEALPPADFRSLVGMLATQAVMYMGGLADRSTGQAIFDPEYSKHMIDLLGVLEEKTKGNLSPEETKELGGVLHELRLRFVELSDYVAKGGGKPGAPSRPPVARGSVDGRSFLIGGERGARSSFLERHHFLFRRLHSLSGVVPIGAFLLVHLTTNASIVWGSLNRVHGDVHGGAATFQHEVNFIHSLPFLLLIEIFVLWLPIAFHAGFGIYYAVSGRPNTKHYRYGGNVRYVLQRLTAWTGLLFILYHVGTLRWGFSRLIPGHMHWEADFAGSTLAAALQGSTTGMTLWGWVIVLFYLVGVSSLVYHLANGIWTAAITWGVTITETAQRRFGYLCAALGAALMVAGWASIIGFASLDYHEARAAEMAVNGPVVVEPGGDVVQETSEPGPGVGGESGLVSGANFSVEPGR